MEKYSVPSIIRNGNRTTHFHSVPFPTDNEKILPSLLLFCWHYLLVIYRVMKCKFNHRKYVPLPFIFHLILQVSSFLSRAGSIPEWWGVTLITHVMEASIQYWVPLEGGPHLADIYGALMGKLFALQQHSNRFHVIVMRTPFCFYGE